MPTTTDQYAATLASYNAAKTEYARLRKQHVPLRSGAETASR